MIAALATKFPKRNARGFYPCPDGVERPSVTTILQACAKPALVGWAAKVEREMVLKVAEDVYYDDGVGPKEFVATVLARLGKEKAHAKLLVAAGDVGSMLHARAEWTFKTELGTAVGSAPPLSPEAAIAFESFESWRKDSGFKPLRVEEFVYSVGHGYAGTLDIVGVYDGKTVVTDLKTSTGVYLEHVLQVAAYREALVEMEETGEPATIGGLIVKLPKVVGGVLETRYIAPEEFDAHFETFLAVKTLWGAMRAWEAR